MMHLVSIVVPVYNAQKYIGRCIKSILKQTYKNWELILVDDGSTDKSGVICDDYARNDCRIKVIHQKNQGSISARRNGVAATTGEYTCFCDADDIMPSRAIECLHNVISPVSCSTVVVGRTAGIWNNFVVPSSHRAPCFEISTPVTYSHKDFIDQLYCSWFGITNLPVSLYAKLYPTSLLKETFATVSNVVNFMGDDLIMTVDILPKADQIIIVPDVVYYYRPGGGTSKLQPKLMDDWLALYRFKSQYAVEYPMPQPIQKLMDIELCNMTFSYFEMLELHNKLTSDVINKTCCIYDVLHAASNPSINPSFEKAKLLREKDISQIRKYVKLTPKAKVKQALKKIYYALA